MKSTAPDPGNRRSFYRRRATLFFVPAALSTFVLGLWRVLGPQSGAEELGIFFPWAAALLIHLLVTVPALFCVVKSRSHLRLSWLYLYFFLFWGFHGYLYVKMSGVDTAVQQKLDTIQKPQESALAALISRMETTALSGAPVDPSRLSEAKALITSGADVTYRNPDGGLSLICRAARIDDPELIRLMVSHGADVEGGGRSSASPLMRAVMRKNPAVVETLLKLQADPNHVKYNPYTPLMRAVKQRDMETVAVLLKGGAIPDLHPNSGIPPLQLAADEGDADIMKLLLAAGADPNRKVISNRFLRRV